jgi:hypothetical protein
MGVDRVPPSGPSRVVFDAPIVASGRMRLRQLRLGRSESSAIDVAVTDDFFYDEPQAIGE